MILLDANLLIYAHARRMPQHERSLQWLQGQFTAGHRVGMPWPTLLTFLRLVTNPRVFREPESVTEAWGYLSRWTRHPQVWIPLPTERHQSFLEALLPHATEANQVPDAHLAALAKEHGLVLCSADADFARFPGLRWHNPLQPQSCDE